MKFFSCVVAMFMFTTVLNAQINFSGIVVSKTDSAPLQGANLVIADSNFFSSTDANGKFSFQLPSRGEYLLKVSFLGYETYESRVLINTNINDFVVELKPRNLEMKEIEVNAIFANEQTPVAYSNVTKEDIEQMNSGVDLPKMLNLMPSLTYSSDNGTGIGYSDMKIRGSDLTRINVTMNGVPLNNSESHEMYFVDMPDFVTNVDNIQIQRGVGTSVDGAAAFGATIDFKTHNVEKNPYSQFMVSGGSFNTMRFNAKAGTGLIKNKFSTNIGISKINSDGFLDRAFSDLLSLYADAGYYGKKLYLKFINITGKETTYQAWNGASMEQMKIHGRSYNPAGEIYYGDSLVGYYDNETDNYLLSNSQLTFGYKFNNQFKLNATLYYAYGTGYYENYKNDVDLSDYQLNPGDIFANTNNGIESTNLVRQKWVNSDTYGFIYSLNYNSNIVDLILGGGLSDYHGEHFGRVIWAKDAIVIDPAKNWYEDISLKKDFNQYLKASFFISKSFNFFVDAQYRRVFYSLDGYRDDFVDITQSNTYNFFNPKAGMVWKNDHNRAYLSLAVGHREPSRDDFTDADYGKTPRPERLLDYEAGYSHNFERVNLSASLYYMKYNDQLVLTGEINNVGAPIMVNVDNSYRTGIELMAEAEIVKNHFFWNANATFSSNKITDFTGYIDDWDNGGQVETYYGTTDISFSPSIIAANSFKIKFLKQFSLVISSKYVGKQYMDNTSNENYKIDPYFVTDLRIDYDLKFNNKLVNNANIFLTINNLFNEEYETKAWVYRYYYGGVEYGDAGYFPQAGINFMVGASIKL